MQNGLTCNSLVKVNADNQLKNTIQKKISNLIAPGSIVTSAAAMFLDALKVLLSMILTVPPGFCIAGTSENLNEYGIGELFGIAMSSRGSCGGGIAIKSALGRVGHEVKCEQGKIYNSCFGIRSNAWKLPGRPKFFAITSIGTCASQSVSINVESSEKDPSSNMRRNSAPSGCVSFAWMEWGWPAGKYQTSPAD